MISITRCRSRFVPSVVLLLLLISAHPALGDDREPGWYDTAELSLISTTGNSEATTFGFKNALERLWDNSRFHLGLGGLSAESDTISRFAVGTSTDFQVQDQSTTNKTAENYYLRTRYDRDISERMFWFAGLGWEQNEFAGFDSRTMAIVGVGNRWRDTDKGHFYTDYGLTYTEQDDINPNPLVKDSFAGAQLGWDFLYNFNEQTTFANVLVIHQNIDETDDSRVDMINSLSVSMTDKLALKVSYQLLFDNLPALESVPLIDDNGNSTGTSVLAELDDLDTVLTAALVIKLQ